MHQDEVMIVAFLNVIRKGSYSVDCGSEREAKLLRFRLYGFVKRFKKESLTSGGPPEKRAELLRAVSGTMLQVEGTKLHFQNRAEVAGMMALTAVVGDDVHKQETRELTDLEEAGNRLLDQFAQSTPPAYPRRGE